MKIAIAFFGSIGKMKRFHKLNYDELEDIDIEVCYRHFKKNVLEHNANLDINCFIHTSSLHLKDKVTSLYPLKSFLFEENSFELPKIIKSKSYEYNANLRKLYAAMSRFHSQQQVIKLIKESGEKYDLVFLLRPDIVFLEPIFLGNLLPDIFYIQNINNKKIKHVWNDPIIGDWFFIANQERIYNFVDECNNSNKIMEIKYYDQHVICKNALSKVCRKFSNVSSILSRYNDHQIYKWLFKEYWPKANYVFEDNFFRLKSRIKIDG